MSRLVIALVMLTALLASGCGTEQKETASQAQTDVAGQTAAADQSAPADQTAPAVQAVAPSQTPAQQTAAIQPLPASNLAAIQTKPSGVRYEEITLGEGAEVVKGSRVVFDYNCYGADQTGLKVVRAIGTSVNRPGNAYKCEVGVHPLPGLSDGLIGMRIGGTRRIYVPWQLGFPDGSPFGKSNIIYEVIGIQEATPDEVTIFQDSLDRRLELIRHIQDSIAKARADSAAGVPKPAEGAKQ